MAKYLILIYGSEQEWDAQTPERTGGEGGRSHRLLRGRRLRKTHWARSSSPWRRRRHCARPGAEPTVTDGPFMETKEALGGFYVVDAEDLDAAIRLARMLPELGEQYGAVEVRPIVDHG